MNKSATLPTLKCNNSPKPYKNYELRYKQQNLTMSKKSCQ